MTKEEEEDAFRAIESQRHYEHKSFEFKCKTENQKRFVKAIRDNHIAIGAGYPGTGKTFLSCAESMRLLTADPDRYRRIILVKSVTTLKGEEVGFLKGELSEKMAPFVESFMDNIRKLIGDAGARAVMAQGIVEVLPLAFARGRTFDNSIIIVDECQNLSKDNLKTILTRIGQDSKIILIGDTKQIDLKDKRLSSLEWFMRRAEGAEGFSIVKFSKEDQVRNPIINVIEDMFDE